jgi:glycosyltransferase involved in cell wall biosynthesis/nucleoside phosphorylase
MKRQGMSDYTLVLTAAFKKELPMDWLHENNIPVITLPYDISKIPGDSHISVLVVITSPGMDASERAARWIRDNINPLYVINIGTCGLIQKNLSLCEWLIPRYVADEHGDIIELNTTFPIPLSVRARYINTLISVTTPITGKIYESWQGYDVVDMECYAQARVFRNTNTSFHCLKFSSDHANHNTKKDFKKSVILCAEQVKKILAFIEEAKKKIEITVIIPVFNRQHTIKHAIDSVLAQSYKPEEIIVVDDCSTDATRDLLQGYGDRITTVFLNKNSGPSRARNEGISRAQTGWLSFLDSDDRWKHDKLMRQVQYLRKYPFYQIIQSEEIWIRNGVRVNPCKHHRKLEGWIWEQSLHRCLVSPSAVLMKKSLYAKYGGFDETLPVCEDYDLWLKLSRHHPVGLEPSQSVIKYGGHSDQLSRKYPAMERYRVRSLLRILENEKHQSFREKIIRVLEQKLKILINGCEKRKKFKELSEYREILASLNTLDNQTAGIL